MIAGFVLQGAGPKQVLIRASGPTLGAFNVPGTVADPVLTLFRETTQIHRNDDWDADAASRTSLETAFAAAGAFAWPAGSRESALLVTLEPGNYTAQVSGKNGGTGVGLVEVYEMAGPAGAKLINISTRSVVRPNAEVQIAGFVIGGDGPRKVIIRASGPALTKYNVDGVLADPVLSVHEGGTLLADNDDWSSSLRPEFQAASIDNWDTGSKDAALVLVLEPGRYTATVSGKGAATGVALIEVFELP